MEALRVPDTRIELYDGSVVMLARFPDLKWVVHHGWYTYNNQQCSGWYFCSIPSNTILPVNAEDLRLLTVVAKSGGCPPPGRPTPPGPHPKPQPGPHPGPNPGPGPGPGPCPCPDPYGPPHPPILPALPKELIKEIDAALIVVETIAQRKKLDTERFPNGKIVCVNDVNGERKYYKWDKSSAEWIEISIEVDVSPFITKEEANATFTTVEQVQALVDEGIDRVTDIVEQTTSPRFEAIETSITELETRVEAHENNTYTKSEIDGFLDWGEPLS